MENNEKISYSTALDITVCFSLHYKDTGEEFEITTEDFNGVADHNGTTVIFYPWDNEGMFFPEEKVIESVEEVKSLYKQALDKKEELYDAKTIIQRIPDSKIWNFCSKTSHEWWQMVMNKWNTLSDEEQKKYNQFIGFNDFSDYLMNIMAGALMKLRDTGKLDYEEGSLLLEKQKQKPVDIGTYNNISKIKNEQK